MPQSTTDMSDPGPSTPEGRYGARLARRSTAEVLQSRLMAQERRNLEEAFRRIAEDGALVSAAQTVVTARRRFVQGAGKSLAYAALLAADLHTAMSNVILVDGAAVRPVDVLAEAGERDVLVAYSFRRYRTVTLDVVREFARAGGRVVLVTDTVDNPVSSSASELIVVPTASESYADSSTAVAAASLILSTLSTARAKGAARRMRLRSDMADSLGLYFHHEEDS